MGVSVKPLDSLSGAAALNLLTGTSKEMIVEIDVTR